MAEFTATERVQKIALAVIAPVAWYVIAAPDFTSLQSKPIGAMSVAELVFPIASVLLLLVVLTMMINLFYEAVTGRDSVWLWHPD